MTASLVAQRAPATGGCESDYRSLLPFNVTELLLISGASNGGGGVGGGPSSVGSQTRWESGNGTTAGGAYRPSAGEKYLDRQALTAALIHFSRALG